MSRDASALVKKFCPPMLATLAAAPPRDESNWFFEVKYDGFRAVSAVVDGDVAMLSRNSLDLTARFPGVTAALSKVKANAVFDGEIVAIDERGVPRFQLLQRGENAPIFLFVFDLLWLDGEDLRKKPIEERRALLEKTLKKPPNGVRVAEQITGNAAAALAAAAKAGHEGLIGKLKGTLYENRRTKNWIKLKAENVQELAIVGFTPHSASDREVGALLLGYREEGSFQYAGKVGTGFSTKLRAELKERLSRSVVREPSVRGAPRMRDAKWVKPELVAQIRFTEWTSDGRLRHPTFLGLRPDKSAREVVREIPAADVATKKKGSTGTAGFQPAKGTRNESATKGRAGSPPPRGPAVVKMTNPDRVLYPRDGITKLDVARYFEAVGDAMIYTLSDRPLALEHWNQGIGKPSWFHQNIGPEGPPWATYISTPTRTSKRKVRHLVVDRPESLQWLAQMSALTLHMWSSRGESLDSPDWMIFDLDPAKGKGIEQAVDTALVLRRFFEQLEIESIPKTSGKRGIHIFVPLAPGQSHEAAIDFACKVAETISSQLDYATTERAIVARKGRLYFDCLQNGYGKTVVAPYSLRAIDGAPVSAPLKWSEVNKKLDPLKFNIRTMPARLQKYGDLFAGAIAGKFVIPEYK